MNLSTNPRPETKSRFIREHEVTLTRLKGELAKAMIDATLDEDGNLLVENTAVCFPVWIEINPDKKQITFSTCDFAPPFKGEVDALRWINAANARMELAQFHMTAGRVWGCHWMSYADGLNIRQLIKTLHGFAMAFKDVITSEPIQPSCRA